MKKILIVAILSIIGSGAFAQNSELMKAEMNLKKNILDKAKEHIDLAAQHDKTKDKSKMFLLRGRVYQAIFLDSMGKWTNLAENPEAVVVESFTKYKEKEGKKGEAKSDSLINNFYAHAINQGAKAYEKNDFKRAQRYFKAGASMIPTDTLSLYYLGVASQQAKDYNTAQEAYNKMLQLGSKNKDLYSNLIYIARNEEKDENKALEIVRAARKAFPQDQNYAQEELNILITTGKLDEAKKGLEEAISREPNNPTYYYNLGFLYDQAKDAPKATEYYEKALKINPNYFEANFNLGVLKYNKAAEILKEVNAMDLKTYEKSGKPKEAQGVALLKEALPYFEKAHAANGEDMAVVETLQTIYSRLNRNADADRMKKVLDANAQ